MGKENLRKYSANSLRMSNRNYETLGYSGANHNAGGFDLDSTENWNPSITSANTEMDGERETMIARHQDLERNDGIVSGLIQTNVDNILTSSFTLSSKIDYKSVGQTKEWADEKGEEIEALWREYAGSKDIDAARVHNFHGLTEQVLRSGLNMGEAAALPHYMKNRKFRTTIQLIDPLRITTPNSLMGDMNVYDGIRTNGYGEETTVYVQKRHPADYVYAEEWESIPMRNRRGRVSFIRMVDRKRIGQTRGKPITSSIMTLLNMRNVAYNGELESVLANSVIAAIAETSMSSEELAGAFGSTSLGQGSGIDAYKKERNSWNPRGIGHANVVKMPIGETLKSFVPSRPNTAFPYFMQELARQLSAGVNLPYELIMKDFSGVNYSSARAALLEGLRFFLGKRRWLSDNWATPVYLLWLEEMVERGIIDLPNFSYFKIGYSRCRWIGAGRGWVDPVKEVKAAMLRIEARLSTYEKECAEQGEDWKEVFDQLAREHKYAEKISVILPSAQIEVTDKELENEDEKDENDENENPNGSKNVNEQPNDGNMGDTAGSPSALSGTFG